MFFKVALVLLILWVLGVIGLFDAGSRVHLLLLIGLMLLLLGALKARDSAVSKEPKP